MGDRGDSDEDADGATPPDDPDERRDSTDADDVTPGEDETPADEREGGDSGAEGGEIEGSEGEEPGNVLSEASADDEDEPWWAEDYSETDEDGILSDDRDGDGAEPGDGQADTEDAGDGMDDQAGEAGDEMDDQDRQAGGEGDADDAWWGDYEESHPAAERDQTAEAAGAAADAGRADEGLRPAEIDAQAASVGGETPQTAPDDQEMPLAVHVEEMANRLLAVVLVMFGIAGLMLFYADELINFLWYSFLDPAPRVFHPLSLVLARLKVATLVGFVLALPVAVYQTYRFMRPGLYPRERRYYLAAVPTSLVLAATGVAVAYFAVLPALFSYFAGYSERAAELAFGLADTFNLIILMLGFFALIFQIPLLVMLAIMMGITTRQWLADRRLYFWGAFAAIAFVFSPDPTGMAPLIVAVTMIGLFDGTLLLLKWTADGSLVPSAQRLAARRPHALAVAALVGYLVSTAPVPTGYYDLLPAMVVETLAANDLVLYTPLLIAGGLIGLFELGALVLRRRGRSKRALRARLAVDSARRPVWLLAIVVGYLGSPTPVVLQWADRVALGPAQTGAVTVALVVAYELLRVGLRYRERRK